jgi:hypothetical protein
MKVRSLLVLAILSPFLTIAASAQRTLQPDEVRKIFQQLTNEPRKTWVAAGTIEAVHQEYGAPKTTDPAEISREIDKQAKEYQANPNKRELAEEGQKMKLEAIPFNVRYKLANEFTMTSHVIVKYDGQRFYWEINVDSRKDSVVPEAALAGNFMTDQFDVGFNQKRIFAWDGEKYTTYTVSGNNAVVDAAGRLPRGVNGPLTAGLIPWGVGQFTLDSLTAAEAAATEVTADGTPQVQMTLAWADGSSVKLTLDPSKNYAVTAATLPIRNNMLVNYQCYDYKQVGGKWVPSRIVIERHDATTNRVLHSEQWTLTTTTDTTPGPDSFNVEFTPGTHINYISPVTKTSHAFEWPSTGGDRLMADRLAYAAMAGKEAQNCATAALKYAASQLGKPVSDGGLARLVGLDHQTSLHAMKAFAQHLGLHCRAVKTDLATLRDLNGVQAILHLPDKQHFVVLDEVDDQSVWLIDLSKDRFCYHRSVHSFPEDWSQGTALLLSNHPIRARLSDLPDSALAAVVGGYWTCTRLYQNESYVICDPVCPCMYQYYYPRWVCESAPAGSCQADVMVRWQETPCDWDASLQCNPTWQWTFHYMRACYHQY